MTKLHDRIKNDKDEWFDELEKRNKESDDEESDVDEPIEKVTWKKSKFGTTSSGKPIKYLSGHKLRETPESEFKRIRKHVRKHK